MPYPKHPRIHEPKMKPELEIRRRRPSADSGIQLDKSQLFSGEPQELTASDRKLAQLLQEVGEVLETPTEPKRTRRDLSLARDLFPEDPKKAEDKARAKVEAQLKREEQRQHNQSIKDTEALLSKLEDIEKRFYSIKYDPEAQ